MYLANGQTCMSCMIHSDMKYSKCNEIDITVFKGQGSVERSTDNNLSANIEHIKFYHYIIFSQRLYLASDRSLQTGVYFAINVLFHPIQRTPNDLNKEGKINK